MKSKTDYPLKKIWLARGLNTDCVSIEIHDESENMTNSCILTCTGSNKDKTPSGKHTTLK